MRSRKEEMSLLHVDSVMDYFKKLQKLVIDCHIPQAFNEISVGICLDRENKPKWHGNQLKEIEVIGKLDFFSESMILRYKKVFPKLEKLIINPWDNGRNFDYRYVAIRLNFWYV